MTHPRSTLSRDDLSPVAVECLQAASRSGGYTLPRTTQAFRERLIVTGLLANDPPLVKIEIVNDREVVFPTVDGAAALVRPTRSEIAAHRRTVLVRLAFVCVGLLGLSGWLLALVL